MANIEQRRIPASKVSIIHTNKSPDVKQLAETIKKYKKQGYFVAGRLVFEGPIQDESEIKSFVGSVGGDLIVSWQKYIGVGFGSRMVVGSYTPGRSINTIAHGSTTANYSGYGVVSNRYTNNYNNYNYAGNMQGSTSSYATTYIPSQTTYVRENYQYDKYLQVYAVFQSERSFRANSKNIRKYALKNNKKKLDDSQLDTLINLLVFDNINSASKKANKPAQ